MPQPKELSPLQQILQNPSSHGLDEQKILLETFRVGPLRVKVACLNWEARQRPMQERTMSNYRSFLILSDFAREQNIGDSNEN